MRLNPKPAQRCRLVATHEGKFVNLDDMVKQLQDERVLDQALARLKVGHEMGDEPRRVMQIVLGNFLYDCAGEKL